MFEYEFKNRITGEVKFAHAHNLTELKIKCPNLATSSEWELVFTELETDCLLDWLEKD